MAMQDWLVFGTSVQWVHLLIWLNGFLLSSATEQAWVTRLVLGAWSWSLSYGHKHGIGKLAVINGMTDTCGVRYMSKYLLKHYLTVLVVCKS